MNGPKTVIWGGATIAVTVILFMFLHSHRNSRDVATDRRSVESHPEHTDTGIIVERPGKGAEQADQDTFSARDSVVTGGEAKTIVPQANRVSEAALERTSRPSVVSDQGITRAAAAASSEANEAEPVEIRFPAPFHPLPDNRNWSADDAGAVAALAKDFNDSVMNSANSPSDPNYYRAWMTAEWLANEKYRSYFGVDAFNALRNPDN